MRLLLMLPLPYFILGWWRDIAIIPTTFVTRGIIIYELELSLMTRDQILSICSINTVYNDYEKEALKAFNWYAYKNSIWL